MRELNDTEKFTSQVLFNDRTAVSLLRELFTDFFGMISQHVLKLMITVKGDVLRNFLIAQDRQCAHI